MNYFDKFLKMNEQQAPQVDATKMAASLDKMILTNPETALYAARGWQKDNEPMPPELFAAATKAGFKPTPAYAETLKAAGINVSSEPSGGTTNYVPPESQPQNIADSTPDAAVPTAPAAAPPTAPAAAPAPAAKKQVKRTPQQQAMIKLQTSLYNAGSLPIGGIDGIWGAQTENALKQTIGYMQSEVAKKFSTLGAPVKAEISDAMQTLQQANINDPANIANAINTLRKSLKIKQKFSGQISKGKTATPAPEALPDFSQYTPEPANYVMKESKVYFKKSYLQKIIKEEIQKIIK